jgi:hypothetical protein
VADRLRPQPALHAHRNARGRLHRPDWIRRFAAGSQLAALRHYATEGDKWYKGLQMGVRKRFSNNFQFQFSYTLAKTEDNAEDFVADPQSYFHPGREKAISNEDQRHRLVLSGSWRLPWDIQVGGILTYSNARPFNITMGTDWNGNGNSEQDRPDSMPTTANLDQGSINDRPYYPEGSSPRGGWALASQLGRWTRFLHHRSPGLQVHPLRQPLGRDPRGVLQLDQSTQRGAAVPATCAPASFICGG